jgi:hypothetical protein
MKKLFNDYEKEAIRILELSRHSETEIPSSETAYALRYGGPTLKYYNRVYLE